MMSYKGSAMVASIASNVGGGLGVFESVLLLTLLGVPKAEIGGAALAFRAVYFLLPFAIAPLYLAARELPRWLRPKLAKPLEDFAP